MSAVTCTQCDRPRLAGTRSTWCREHKNEWQRAHRRKQGVPPRVRPLVDRLLERVAEQPNGCVLWTGQRTSGGYGTIGSGVRGKSIGTHVAAYLLFVGPIPDGHEIDHLCDETLCCAPAHLEAVTHSENQLRAAARRRLRAVAA